MNATQTSLRLAREMGVVRQKKIAKIRTKIISGKYHVKNTELVKALLIGR